MGRGFKRKQGKRLSSPTITSPTSEPNPKKRKRNVSTQREDSFAACRPVEPELAIFDDKITLCLRNDQKKNAIFWADKKLTYIKKGNSHTVGTTSRKLSFVAIVDYLKVLTATQAWSKVTDFVQAEDCIFAHVCVTFHYVNSLWQQELYHQIVQLPMSLINGWEGVPFVQPQDHQLKYSRSSYYASGSDKHTLDLVDIENKVESALLLIMGKTYLRVCNRVAATAALENCIIQDPACFEAWSLVLSNHLLKKSVIEEFLRQLSEEPNELFDIVKLYVEAYIDVKEECVTRQNSVEVVGSSSTSSRKNNDDVASPSSARMRTRSQNKSQADTCLDQEIIAHRINEMKVQKERLKMELEEDIDMRSLAALKHFNSGDSHQALTITEDLFKKYGSGTNLFYLHLAILTHLKKSSLLYEIAHDLVDKSPENELAWYAVGCYYLTIENWFAAKNFFHKAIQINSNFGAAWIAMGHANSLSGEHGQSLNCYSKAHKLLENCFEPVMYIGIEHMKTNNITLAEAFLKDSLKLSLNDVNVLMELGALYYGKSEFEKCEEYWMKAFNFGAGLNQDKMLSYNQIENVFKSRNFPLKWSILLNNLGMVNRKLKKWKRALLFHYKAMSIDRKDSHNLISAAMCHGALKNYELSLQAFNEAATMTDDGGTQDILSHSLDIILTVYAKYTSKSLKL
uniref:TPR_REGION domain-containing protein n=1 Tax=Rhabditophanes sp. KR3021 TaxID=114890 RepID=A0AC35UC73_9BILA